MSITQRFIPKKVFEVFSTFSDTGKVRKMENFSLKSWKLFSVFSVFDNDSSEYHESEAKREQIGLAEKSSSAKLGALNWESFGRIQACSYQETSVWVSRRMKFRVLFEFLGLKLLSCRDRNELFSKSDHLHHCFQAMLFLFVFSLERTFAPNCRWKRPCGVSADNESFAQGYHNYYELLYRKSG